MSFFNKFFSTQGQRPLLDVVADLSAAVVDSAIVRAKQAIADLRASGNTIAPGDTQFILDEYLFLQLHLTDRAAAGALSLRTQDIFLPTFVGSTVWRHLKTQAPDWPGEEIASHEDALLRAFDHVNAEYNSQKGSAATAGLAPQMLGLFAQRVLAAARVRPTPDNLLVVMNSTKEMIAGLALTKRFAEIVQLPHGPTPNG